MAAWPSHYPISPCDCPRTWKDDGSHYQPHGRKPLSLIGRSRVLSLRSCKWNLIGPLRSRAPIHRWQKAIRKRGYQDLSKISCAPQSAGHFPAEGYGERRILKVPCYQQRIRSGREHPIWSRPIEGVLAVVDVDGGEVIDVIDTGPMINAGDVSQHGLGVLPPRALPKPVYVVSPQGPNFTMKGALQVNWHNWSFHMRADRRAGLILSCCDLTTRATSASSPTRSH